MGIIERAIASQKRSAENLIRVLPEDSPARKQLLAKISRLDRVLAKRR